MQRRGLALSVNTYGAGISAGKKGKHPGSDRDASEQPDVTDMVQRTHMLWQELGAGSGWSGSTAGQIRGLASILGASSRPPCHHGGRSGEDLMFFTTSLRDIGVRCRLGVHWG